MQTLSTVNKMTGVMLAVVLSVATSDQWPLALRIGQGASAQVLDTCGVGQLLGFPEPRVQGVTSSGAAVGWAEVLVTTRGGQCAGRGAVVLSPCPSERSWKSCILIVHFKTYFELVWRRHSAIEHVFELA